MRYGFLGSLRSVPEEKESDLSCEFESRAERIQNRLGVGWEMGCGTGLGLGPLRRQGLQSSSLWYWWRWVTKLAGKEAVVSLACLTLLQ